LQNACKFTTRLQSFGLRMPIDGVVKTPLQASIFTPGRMNCMETLNFIVKCTKKTKRRMKHQIKWFADFDIYILREEIPLQQEQKI